MKNAVLGNFLLDTDAYAGDKLAFRHIPSGNLFLVNSDGGIVPQSYSSLPAAPETGAMFFDSRRGIPGWYDRDHYEWPTFVDDVETSDEQISNTTTETEVLRFNINPGGLVEGRILILRNFGIYNTAASTDRFTYRVKLGESGFDAVTGGTTIAALPTVQENVTDGAWHAKTTMIVDTDAENGELDAHTEGRFNDTPNDDHTRDVTLDTTTAEEFVATIKWNNAKADNVARQDMSYLQQQA